VPLVVLNSGDRRTLLIERVLADSNREASERYGEMADPNEKKEALKTLALVTRPYHLQQQEQIRPSIRAARKHHDVSAWQKTRLRSKQFPRQDTHRFSA